MNLGVLVSHFNSPSIIGQIKEAIDKVCSENDEVLMMISSPGYRQSPCNPLSYEMKSTIIKDFVERNFVGKKVTIAAVHNCRYLSEWFTQLDFSIDSQTQATYRKLNTTIYVDKTEDWFSDYKGPAKVEFLDLPGRSYESMLDYVKKNDGFKAGTGLMFRMGIMHANILQPAKIIPRITLITETKSGFVLAIKKYKYEKNYALPEIFFSNVDKSVEMTANLGLKMYFPSLVVSRVTYLGSNVSEDDWWVQNSGDRILNLVCRIKLDSGAITPSGAISSYRLLDVDDKKEVLELEPSHLTYLTTYGVEGKKANAYARDTLF